jgi:hypothetical protein
VTGEHDYSMAVSLGDITRALEEQNRLLAEILKHLLRNE